MLPKNLRILIVDDQAIMHEMMIPMLKDLGYEKFTIASNGIEAWEKLNADQDIHIVLSDLIMPKASGIDLLNKIRDSHKFWDLPFVMITGDENQNQLMNSIEIEVNAYILKPFTPEKLEKEIKAVLNEKYNPSPYHVLLQKGRELIAQGQNPEQAMQYFAQAMERQPLEADPYYFTAIVQHQDGDISNAKKNLRKCISLKSAHTKAHDLLALVFHREKNYEAEVDILQTISELSPDNMERNIALGVAYGHTNDAVAAQKHLKNATKLAKRDKKPVHENIFRAYLVTNGLEADAKAIYRKYIDKYMDTPRLLNKYAMILKSFKAYDSAISFLDKIVTIWRTVKKHDIPPNDMCIYYFNLTVCHIEKTKRLPSSDAKKEGYQKAEKTINQALDCNPKHQDSQKILGWLENKV